MAIAIINVIMMIFSTIFITFGPIFGCKVKQ